MTNTEFIVRDKSGTPHPLWKPAGIHFSAFDGALILGFLAAFIGLVFLLSK